MADAQKLDSYPQMPGSDYITGSTRTPCIDTGVTIDRYSKFGRLYLSEDTVGNYARMLGWIAPADADRLKVRAIEAEEETETLRAKLAQYDTIRVALESAGFSDSDDTPVSEPFEAPVPNGTANAETTAQEATEGSYPEHRGGPWWTLSNGDTFQGSREGAEHAEAEAVVS